MLWSAESLSSMRSRCTPTLIRISHINAGGRLIARSGAPPPPGPWRLTLSKGIEDSADPATLSAFRPALSHRPQPQPQRVELDEALGVALIVGALIVLEGDVLHRVERARRPAADHRRIALVELQPDRA